jgi:hypothetical protein
MQNLYHEWDEKLVRYIGNNFEYVVVAYLKILFSPTEH